MCIDPRAARAGYRWCRRLARSHYENFPVASWLLPARLRDPVAAIYAFARTADDIADEDALAADTRLRRLAAMGEALGLMADARAPAEPLYQALADTIHRHRLPLPPFHDLLSAFGQDVTQTRYQDFGQLMDYCRRSANPIGRLLLHLHGHSDARDLAYADAICSALQLINFLQDIASDYQQRGRIYLPADEMARFGVREVDIAQRRNSPAVHALVRFQIERCARLLRAGSPLGRRLEGRFALELRAIVLGGSRVLEKLHRQQDIYSRPRLSGRDRLGIAWGALRQGFA